MSWILVMAGCDPDPTAPPVVVLGDPPALALAGPCPLNTRSGSGFTVFRGEDYSTVGGGVADGSTEATREQVAAEGDCALLRETAAVCDPPCDEWFEVCVGADCAPLARNQDLGVVTVDGLREPVIVEAVPGEHSYFVRSTPHPVVEPGALVTLATDGSTFGGDFTLHGYGVELLSLDAVDWRLVPGEDFAVGWAPPTVPGAEIRLDLIVDDAPGVGPSLLSCTFDDDGTGTIPGALLARLVDDGVSGTPYATVTRRTVDATPVAGGCAELAVTSARELRVYVEGYLDCVGHHPCPPGMYCDYETRVCE